MLKDYKIIRLYPYKIVYYHLQGQKGEQGKPGLAGRQGAKVLSNCFVIAFEDEVRVCLEVIIYPCVYNMSHLA